jgi:hypothetical protein
MVNHVRPSELRRDNYHNFNNIRLIMIEAALSPSCCVPSGEATHTNFIVLGLTRWGLEPTIYRTRGEHANHYTTDTVYMTGRMQYLLKCTKYTCNISKKARTNIIFCTFN